MATPVQAKNLPKRKPPTAERVRATFDYDPDTGIFTRLVEARSGRGGGHLSASIGDVAGHQRRDGYIAIKIDRIAYKAHRLAWLHVHGEWPPNEIDHINGDRGDNR